MRIRKPFGARRMGAVLFCMVAGSMAPCHALAQPLPPANISPPVGQAPPPWLPPGAPQADSIVVMPPGYLERPGHWPRRMPVEEGGSPPPLGYHRGKEPRRGLWIAGTSVFSAVHAITGIVGGAVLSADDDGNSALLFIPIFGPVIWAPTEVPLDTEDGRGLFAAMSLVTAAQGVGFALMVAGFAFRKPVFYRNDVDAKIEQPAVRPTFSLGPNGIQAGFSF